MKARVYGQFPAKVPETYKELAQLYLPRRINDKLAHRTVTELVDWLSVRAETEEQIEYLDFISDLLEQYESRYPHSEPDQKSDPLEVLRYLVEENGITTRELGRILGVDHSVAARILTGSRSITIEHAKHLGARFKVAPELFLGL